MRNPNSRPMSRRSLHAFLSRRRPHGMWQWCLSLLSGLLLALLLAVGYDIFHPADLGQLITSLVLDGMLFPLSLLIGATGAAGMLVVAWLSRARLAAEGFALAALVAFLLAAVPAGGMWLMARGEGVPVSVLSQFAPPTHPKFDAAKVSRDIVYGVATDGTALKLDLWPASEARSSTPRPAFVRVHEIDGEKGEMPAWNIWLNQMGYVVFDVGYRMAPPERWKDAIGDIKCALGWITAHAGQYGIDTQRIHLIGYSAGGALAMAAAYGAGAAALPASCPAPAVAVRSVVNLYGPSDLKALYETTASTAFVQDVLQQDMGGPPQQYPSRYRTASPLTYIGPGSPPTITLLGALDRVVPRGQADALNAALTRAGVTHETYLLPGVQHGFDANWGGLGTQFARAKIRAFLQRVDPLGPDARQVSADAVPVHAQGKGPLGDSPAGL